MMIILKVHMKWIKKPSTVKPRNLLILGPSKTPQISKSADYRLQQGWTCCSVLHCQNRGLGALGWRANGKNHFKCSICGFASLEAVLSMYFAVFLKKKSADLRKFDSRLGGVGTKY